VFNSWLALAFETAQLGLARLRRMIERRQGPPCAIRLKPSPVHNPGLKRSFWVRAKIDTVAAMNKSLARTISGRGAKARLPVMTAALCFCYPPEHFTGSKRGRPAVFADSRQARMNPSHHGSDEQVFGAKQQFCTGASGLRGRFAQ
jgi:hypothetical protein